MVPWNEPPSMPSVSRLSSIWLRYLGLVRAGGERRRAGRRRTDLFQEWTCPDLRRPEEQTRGTCLTPDMEVTSEAGPSLQPLGTSVPI